MKTSISSKAFVALPTDRQNIYRIDAHLCGESAQKKWSDISIRGRFPLNVVDSRTDGHLLL